jgi:hypothetical protein
MPVIQPDTSEMTDFEASVPNPYRARIKSVEIVESKEINKNTGKKTPGIKPAFEFRAPRLADREERDVTRTAWLATSGKGTFGYDQLLRCTGFASVADATKANPGKVAFDTDDLIGKEVVVVVTTGEYNGKNQDNIQSFLPVGS